jgi:EH domain-containing protein 1
MRGQDDKVRIVLNKADSIDQQELMRVYGALMWSLGKGCASQTPSKPGSAALHSELCNTLI